MNLLANTPNISQDLFPNLYTFIAHLIATAIILFFLVFFVWKPFKKFLNNRSKYIADNIATAENNRKVSEENRQVAASKLVEAKVSAAEIVERSRGQAKLASEDLVNEAKKTSQAILTEARLEVIKNQIKSEENIKKEILNSAVLITEKVLNQKLDEEENKKLVEQFISELEKEEK